VLAKEVQSEEGAEARFLLADLLYRTHKVDEAEKRINEFIEMSSPHHFWLGKSFILLADIFVDKKDLFQARYTLQSVVDNYGVKDDGILETAKVKLEPLLEDQAPKEKSSSKVIKRKPEKKNKEKVNDKKLKNKQQSDSGTLSEKDAQSILEEMVGEADE